MLSYIVLNMSVISCVLLALLLTKKIRGLRKTLPILLIMCVLTAVFDNVIIGLDIVRYNPAHWSGIKIGLAPIEDFAYTLVAAVLMPLLWKHGSKS